MVVLTVKVVIGGWGGESNREIVSFRSCVRVGEARRGEAAWEARAHRCQLAVGPVLCCATSVPESCPELSR